LHWSGLEEVAQRGLSTDLTEHAEGRKEEQSARRGKIASRSPCDRRALLRGKKKGRGEKTEQATSSKLEV